MKIWLNVSIFYHKCILLYQWQNNIVEETEVVVLAKTTKAPTKKAMITISESSYINVLLFFLINTDKIDEDFLRWINNN